MCLVFLRFSLVTLFPCHLYAPNSTPSPSTSLSLSPVLSPPSSCACRLAGAAQSRLTRAARARGTGATCRKLAYLLNTSFSSNSCHTIERARTPTGARTRSIQVQVSTPHFAPCSRGTRATRPLPSVCCSTLRRSGERTGGENLLPFGRAFKNAFANIAPALELLRHHLCARERAGVSACERARGTGREGARRP